MYSSDQVPPAALPLSSIPMPKAGREPQMQFTIPSQDTILDFQASDITLKLCTSCALAINLS